MRDDPVIVYRTDARELEPGEEITSPGDHRDELPNEETKAAEDAIRAGQLNGERIRATSLYVYRPKQARRRAAPQPGDKWSALLRDFAPGKSI